MRSASVTDFWTGNTLWSEKTQERIQKTARLIAGDEAYKYMKKGEGFVHDVVAAAKTTIVVRSVVVMRDNIASNALYLQGHGISPITALPAMWSKFRETVRYSNNRDKIVGLEVEMAEYPATSDQARRVKAQIAALEEENRKMSIHALVEAGEFTVISEDLDQSDKAIREGRWSDFVSRQVERLPDNAQGLTKNILLTRDSAIFQGLNRMVQYGDFVAKAVLYDHLTGEEKKSQREALDTISEEFVMYNRNVGRHREALESAGLIWFMNYKIRIMKVIARLLREKPASALLLFGVTMPASGVQSPADSSLIGAAVRGTLPFSIGPEQGFRSPLAG